MKSKTITRNQIKARLTEKGIKLVDIANDLIPPVSRSAVTATLAGRCQSKRIREAVAGRLGTTVGKLWRRAA